MPTDQLTLHDHVKAAAKQGLRVFPLPPRGKAPRLKKWQDKATTNLEVIDGWWQEEPSSNYGIATGCESKVVVIDFDGVAPEIPGIDELPETYTVKTARGLHLYYRSADPNLRNSASKLGLKIDVRANGGFVVGPGSVHPSGAIYTANTVAIADLPPILHARILAASRKEQLEDLTPEQVEAGNRNDWLTAEAGRMRGVGATMAEIEERLSVLNSRFPEPLDDGDVRKISGSVSQYKPNDQFTDLGNAMRLVGANIRDLRYVGAWRQWLVWNARCWERDETHQVERLAHEQARQLRLRSLLEQDKQKAMLWRQWANTSESAGKLEACVKTARTLLPVQANAKHLDQHPYLLNVQNGTIDLRTQTLGKHDRLHLLTKLAPVQFDPSADCPTFKRFIGEILGQDAELIEFLQRLAGYCLTGDTSEQMFCLLWGHGANGKSTLVELLRDLLGQETNGGYSIEAGFETFLANARSESSGPREDLARMAGCRLATGGEGDEGRRFSEAVIKKLTGTDVVTARRLYQNSFEFRPECKILLSTNHKPSIRSTGKGMWRRVYLVPFTFTVADDQKDKQLPARLRQEFPGILNWALEGCRKWFESGLTKPAVIAAATDEYHRESDSVQRFVDERCVIGGIGRVQNQELYNAFKRWCEDGNEYCPSVKAFGARLEQLGISESDRTKNGLVRIGIKLSDDGPRF